MFPGEDKAPVVPTTASAPKPDAAPPAPERRPPVARRSAGIGAAAAPVEAAVAAPKMPSVADFERELQERSKPLTEAIERQRTFLQGEEATSKEEAKRDRMLALAQAVLPWRRRVPSRARLSLAQRALRVLTLPRA
jgi:hypothetical protein